MFPDCYLTESSAARTMVRRSADPLRGDRGDTRTWNGPGLAQPKGMPRISAFFGIVISMYYEDHLPPHFHAHYAGSQASIRIDTLEVLSGSLPRRALALVAEWALLHRPELAADWERARHLEPLESIPPLD